MSVSLLLLTHATVGISLLDAAKQTLDSLPLNVKALSVMKDSCPDKLIPMIEKELDELDEGDGILILTDLFGATPSNLAQQFNNGHSVRVVSGVNLSMLIRVLNYPALNIEELCEKALSGGKDGVISLTSNSLD